MVLCVLSGSGQALLGTAGVASVMPKLGGRSCPSVGSHTPPRGRRLPRGTGWGQGMCAGAVWSTFEGSAALAGAATLAAGRLTTTRVSWPPVRAVRRRRTVDAVGYTQGALAEPW
jgi:hypothetical protein